MLIGALAHFSVIRILDDLTKGRGRDDGCTEADVKATAKRSRSRRRVELIDELGEDVNLTGVVDPLLLALSERREEACSGRGVQKTSHHDDVQKQKNW